MSCVRDLQSTTRRNKEFKEVLRNTIILRNASAYWMIWTKLYPRNGLKLNRIQLSGALSFQSDHRASNFFGCFCYYIWFFILLKYNCLYYKSLIFKFKLIHIDWSIPVYVYIYLIYELFYGSDHFNYKYNFFLQIFLLTNKDSILKDWKWLFSL